MDAGGQREIRFNAAIQYGDPPQRQTQFGRRAQQQMWGDLEILDVQIGLVEAIEKNQPIGASAGQPVGHIGHGAEIGTELHGHRDGNGLLHVPQHVQVDLFDLGA